MPPTARHGPMARTVDGRPARDAGPGRVSQQDCAQQLLASLTSPKLSPPLAPLVVPPGPPQTLPVAPRKGTYGAARRRRCCGHSTGVSDGEPSDEEEEEHEAVVPAASNTGAPVRKHFLHKPW